MKILKIEFQNINSLKGTHHIDFTAAPFTASSLFAITGPTGSGKSTILDVISLALFNQVPRLGKISKGEIISKGAILTRNQKEAFARVTYQSKSGIFASQWSISTNRNNNLRDYEMEIADVTANTVQDLKKSDVPAKNEELIGLNYDQFIKAVLLAQGEFAQFLRAKKDERGELLEKITGTGIYRQLGIRAFEKNREANRDIESQQNEIKIIEQNLLEEEKLKEHNKQFEQKNLACENFEKEIGTLQKAIELKEHIEKQQQEIRRLEKQKSQADEQLKTFEKEHGFPLKQHEKVQDFSDELRSWNLLKIEMEKLENEFSNNKKRAAENSAEIEKLQSRVSTFIKEEVAAKDLEQKLQLFQNKVVETETKKQNRQNEYKIRRSEFLSETKDLPFQLNERNLQENETELRELQHKIFRKAEDLKESLSGLDLENPQKLKEQLQQKLKLAREATRDFFSIEKTSEEKEKLKLEKGKLEPQLETLPGELKDAEQQVKLYKSRLENLNLQKENQLLRASLEEHRHNLKEGEACPLCGATQHPFAEGLPEKDPAQDRQIKETEALLQEWNQKLHAYNLNFKNITDRLKELEENSRQLEKAADEQQAKFAEKYAALPKAENYAGWEKSCNSIEQQLEFLEDYLQTQKQSESVAAGLPLLKNLQEILEEGKQLKEQLSQLYSGDNIQRDCRQLQTTWINLRAEQKNYRERAKEIAKASEEKRALKERLQNDLASKITEKGFPNTAEAFAALMPDAECNALRTEKANIQKQIDHSAATLKLLHSQLETAKKMDVEKEKNMLHTELEEKKEKFKNISDECKEIHRLLKNHEENLERLTQLKNQIAEKEKETRRWRLLNELIGDSRGKNFNDFAQDLSLTQLLRLANVRLKDLSDRYSIDKPAEDEDDGLVAIDEHMGGQRRSVKTLSGGETFILSLSMALALSDLASKNVEINSLFIDEGFGTLDPETLDQTLDTLEKLQAESSKTIGIISHVDSLKERIATQIQLKRNGQGYSSLEVRG
ncbi:AAA family ATPase [Zunongwangia sp. F363]|uniref:AAA family ATPase n=1 Tax=Autumnicola tepida TaxID=3075595 RepID=A0ABU3CC41_9FLAO|nr:AAA family ATPase [Zunongwangia sp. F363]MDT0643907.1 AAA family ATPase [Zunongwangia sp. F363]